MAAAKPCSGDLPQSQGDSREKAAESDESGEEEEVETDDEEGSDVASVADLCDPDADSDEDPTFDPDADGDLEVEAVLRARMSRMSISTPARKGRKGSAVPKLGKEETDLLTMVDTLMQDVQLEKLKVYECKAYLRMHKLRLTGKKEVLLNRIREHIEVRDDGEMKYPMSSFLLNCKGDACKGDVVIFEQNIYKRKKGGPREVKGHLCGQRTNAGRIIKESYGTAKQQHTFTIEILWSKGYKPWPPLHPLLIKGRNLYKDRTMRQPWPDEEERKRVIQEKHERGCLARKSRAARIHKKEIEKMAILNMMKDNKIKEQQNMNQKRPQESQQQKAESTNTSWQRISEMKGPSLQNVEPGNTRKQHIPSNSASTHHNEVLPQKVAIRTFKEEFIDRQVSSIQHGGVQREVLSEPTYTQQAFKDSSQHQSFQQQNDVLPQVVAIRTSRKAFIDQQAPSQHNGGSGNTRHHQIFSKATPSMFKYPQQAPKHEDQIEEGGLKNNYREQLFDHQNNTYHATEYDNSSFQTQGKFTKHASVQQQVSNPHQNAQGGHPAHQTYRPRNQDQNSACCTTEYIDSSFQHQGKFTQHANAYQRGSKSRTNAAAHHQLHHPFRPRNQDFNSSDQCHGHDYYHQGYHDYRGVARSQYYPLQSRHQNYYEHRPMTQDQYHTYQNHHWNYDGHRETNHNQYHWPHQFSERPRLCRYYYRHGWCPYKEACWYSHDV
ncbi:hypothetical protein U9M48_008994 [Paspalum notatum var. saurae]|uniref:C3H1-type domain-containing protein n=1 Tax=Paspalum notatum var. saurae TaxID=547442 RepID=A0AAQ3SQF5_PASNO